MRVPCGHRLITKQDMQLCELVSIIAVEMLQLGNKRVVGLEKQIG
jgi:hypothetical protein